MKSRPIVLQSALDEIIRKCTFCTVGMVDHQGKPYILPMNFGYANGVVYLHSAPEGKKVDILRKNNQVCINFSTDLELRHQHEDMACSYSMRYRSVLLYGRVEFIDNPDEKRKILDVIMQQYTKRSGFKYNDPAVNNVLVYRILAEQIEGRVYGY